ncbi:hybrid sensor histidine kinase/response regulator [Rhodoferax sp. AJA081-3]|uniref:ATP-binding response regulator n=1 Tax=Rhodoferax sp. AJA081-3 TaxID=2752316 RepID=UPI001AE08868|nr:hybrid sensor histidine kinase/response regulator [Rhodoferax sp. AJA081-3]QTN28917.1 hybrid sensor histidine kinase/response regulator [Rhodoferax sp. AJA081-3]
MRKSAISRDTDAEEQRLQAHILSAQVKALFATYLSSSIAGAVFALGTSVLLYWLWPAQTILLWYGLHFAVRLLIPLQGRAFDRDPLGLTTHASQWRRRHAWEMLAFSVIWGLLPWAVPPGDNLDASALMMILILTLSNVGAPSLTISMSSVKCFVIPMTLGLAANLAWQGTVLSSFLALSCLLNMAVTLHYARQQHESALRMIRSQFENQSLAGRLAQQVDQVVRSDTEKTRFLAAANHDMRQPLHAISLFGAVLERELHAHPQGVNARHLMGAVRALSDSLDAMLDVSQLDAGGVHATKSPIPLQPVLQSLGAIFAARAEEKGLQLRLRTSALWVQSDAFLLQRLVSNLVDNAIKYTEQGGVLIVARQRGPEVWLDVVDTGIGIAPELQQRVFDEFFQVDNPGRDRSRGLGLGLSVVHRLASLLEHPMEVHSRPGRGSRFRIRLVQASIPSLPAGPMAADTAPLHNAQLPKRVLLIDDEVSISVAVTALLHSFKVELVSVRDEAQARAAIAQAHADQAPFETVICDMRLAHGVDGLAVARSLAALAPAHAPWQTMLITGETSPDTLRRIQDSGLTALYKPVNAQALLNAIRVPPR